MRRVEDMKEVPYPAPSSAAVTAVMKGNRKTDTKPETVLRSALHRAGYRFRKNHLLRVQGVAVRPDIVFTKQRVAVFVDGCFWHGCPTHGTTPKSNVAYWGLKLERNRMRDRTVTGGLQAASWTVIRVWEHDTIEAAASRVAAAL